MGRQDCREVSAGVLCRDFFCRALEPSSVPCEVPTQAFQIRRGLRTRLPELKAPTQLCDHKLVTQPLPASVVYSVKWAE